MIKFTEQEYKQWCDITKELAAKTMALQAEWRRNSNDLLSAAGIDPETANAVEVPEKIAQAQEKLTVKLEGEMHAAQLKAENAVDPLIQRGLDRALKDMNAQAIYEDAKKTVYAQAYSEMQYDITVHEAEEASTYYRVFGGVYGGSQDLHVEDHILILQDMGEKGLWEDLDALVDRYKNGEIGLSEAEPYKDYNPIVVEISTSKHAGEPLSTEEMHIETIVRPTQSVIANTDLGRQVFANRPHETEEIIVSTLKVTTGKLTHEPKVSAQINYEGLENLTVMNRTGRIGRYDSEVYNAVSTLYDAGNKGMTVDMIANAMFGYKLNDKPTDSQRKDIMDSLRRLAVLRIKIDTKAADSHFPELESVSLESSALYVDFVQARYHNNTCKQAVKVKETPLLLAYAQGVGQVVRTDIHLLAVPLQMTGENIMLRNYLYERVLGATGRSHYNTILVDSILKDLGIQEENYSSRKAYMNKRVKIVNASRKVLDYWKEQGFIPGYETETDGVGRNPKVTKFVISKDKKLRGVF